MAGIYKVLICGGFVRFLLFLSGYANHIRDRVEISTPLNSWKRVVEGVHMKQHGISPYDGDLFHETPIMLVLFEFILQKVSDNWIPAFFIFCDGMSAFLLYKTAEQFGKDCLVNQKKNMKNYAEDSAPLLLKKHDSSEVALYVAVAYLLNPYILLNCIGRTTTVIGNLLLAASFFSSVKGYRVPLCVLLALLTCRSLYPCMLIVPAALSVAVKDKMLGKMVSIICTGVLFIIAFLVLEYLSYVITGDWKFLNAVYGFILNVPDLTPNIGLFWYFFTEMFEHFRLLFISTFQINAFLYVIPLTFRFHNDPVMLTYSLITMITIFKSYPCIGDVGFHLALLPMWKHLQQFMQQSFIVGCFFLATSVLAPILWHLWIHAGSANANFFFGATLAFGTAQIFLVTDVLFAYTKREFHLIHGLKKEIDGKSATLVLE